MTSKTFKSALDSPVTLEVERETHPAGVYLTIGQATILLGASDAPALALAILEAAGVEPDREPLECQVSLGTIVADLQGTIQYAEALASANREQAKLEAEALNLYRAYMAVHEPMNAIGDWQMLAERTKEKWLAVARRARELRAEK